MKPAIRGRRAVVAALAAAAVAGPLLTASAGAGATGPSFRAYAPPPGLARYGAGEPTLGIHPRTGAILVQASVRTLRLTGAGTRRPQWRDVTPTNAVMLGSLDPLIEMSATTGRAWVSHLNGACSLMAYSDDAGSNWTDVPLGCGAGAMYDHQALGAGPGVLYYCAHDLLAANCATSADGGDTFRPAVPAWTTAYCGAPHGHVTVAADGTAYLPPIACFDNAAATAVTEDGGLTWRMSRVPGGTMGGDAGNPSVGVGAGGAAYLAWGGRVDGGFRPQVAVTRDRGRTWSRPAVLGRGHGVVNTRFVSAVAGDDDRAAVSFLGSRTPGDAGAEGFAGTWSLYVALTYDGGRTWRTYDALPSRPVHRGGVCLMGMACPGRARVLLDFADLAIDAAGRVVAVVASSCRDPRCTSVATDSGGTNPVVVRQEAGALLRRRPAR
ncbi:MAG TPA: sialidase family protein [Frankiaceae bacterium]|nr:sialidase family protein [Frankiaceae bacterium]